MATTDEEAREAILDNPYANDPNEPPPIDWDDPLQNLTDGTPLYIEMCNATIGEDLFEPKPFEASERLERTNELAIRFGGSNNMITLLEGDSDDKEAYIWGLIASSIVMAIFFAVWCLLIVIAKCLGHRGSGFLCGKFVRPMPPPMYDNDEEEEMNDNGTDKDNNEEEHSKENNMDESQKVAVELSDAKNETEKEGDPEPPLKQQEEDNSSTFVSQIANFLSAPFSTKESSEAADAGAEETDQKATPTNTPTSTPEDTHSDNDPSAEIPAHDEHHSLEPDENHSAKDASNNHEDGSVDDAKITSHSTIPEDASPAYVAWVHKCRRQEERLFRTRIALVISCVMMSVSGILFCVYGDKYINSSFDSIESGLRQIQRLCEGGIAIIDRFEERQLSVENQTQQNLQRLNGLCPGLRESLCETIEPEVQNCNFTDLPFIEETFEKVFDLIYIAKAYLYEELYGLRDELQDLYDDIENLLNGSIHLEWAYWVSFGFCIALIVCCVVICGGIYQAHRRRLSKVQDWIRQNVFFPVLCFLVFMAFAFGIAFIIAAVGASDWCIDSPDSKVAYILENNKDKIDSVIYRFAVYFVSGCRDSLYPLLFADNLQELLALMQDVGYFSHDLRSVSQNPTVWENVCGSGPDFLDGFGSLLELGLCLMLGTMEDLNRFFWCRHWSPLYTIFMYDAVCYDAQSGLAWVASTMFFIVLFAFVVLFLRAGAYDIIDEDEYLIEVRRWRVCCFRLVTFKWCRKHWQHTDEEEDKVALNESDPVKAATFSSMKSTDEPVPNSQEDMDPGDSE